MDDFQKREAGLNHGGLSARDAYGWDSNTRNRG